MHKSLDTNKLFVSGKQTRIIKRFFFSKLGILPNYNSLYELTALFQLLLYAFANGLSAEEASNQLKIELPDSLRQTKFNTGKESQNLRKRLK